MCATLLERPTGHLPKFSGVLFATRLHYHHTTGIQETTQFVKIVLGPAFLRCVAFGDWVGCASGSDDLSRHTLMWEEGFDA